MSQALSYLTVPTNNAFDYDELTDPDEERFDDALNPTITQLSSMDLSARGRDGRHSSASSRGGRSRNVTPAAVNANIAQELYQVQNEYADLRTRYEQSEQERQALSDRLQQATRRGKKKPSMEEQSGNSSLMQQERKVSECGKKYALLHRPWASKENCAKLSEERPLVNLDDTKRRFRDMRTQEDAHLAEMWDILAADPIVKPLLGNALWLHKKFREMVHDEKSKFVHTANTNIVEIFGSLGIDRESLGTPGARKNCAALQALGPKGPNDYYCDVLYPEGHEREINWLFRTRRIVVVIQSGILGQGSPRGAQATNTLSKAHQWGIKEVTPGLIAFAAVVLVYLISGDNTFSPKNSTLKVTYDYPLFFYRFVWLMITKRDTPGTQELFQWMNHQVFGTERSGMSADSGDEALDGDIEALNNEIEAMFGLAGTDPIARSSSPQLVAAPRPPARGSSTQSLAAAVRPSSRSPSPMHDAPRAAPSRAPSLTHTLSRLAPSQAPPTARSASRPASNRSSSGTLYPPHAATSRARPLASLTDHSRAASPTWPVHEAEYTPISRGPSPAANDAPLVLPSLFVQPQGVGAGIQLSSANARMSAGIESQDQSLPPAAPAPKPKRSKKNAATVGTEQQQPIAGGRVLRNRS
ncbi:hypothetical protein BC835DRAFT_1304173 [Cytidiella melzeri]|nr:hypothetical protein BC835DRAFT_1304173 [Cytidiella melzeri]